MQSYNLPLKRRKYLLKRILKIIDYLGDLNDYEAWIVYDCLLNSYYDSITTKKYHLSMYIPKIDKMWKDNNVKDALKLIATNGRRSKIALRWNAKDFKNKKLPDSIRFNTKYLLVLSKKKISKKKKKLIQKQAGYFPVKFVENCKDTKERNKKWKNALNVRKRI